MGSVISKAANGIGGVLGNAFSAPFKSIFGDSCPDICSGPWDLICFIEHLCVTNLIKLFMIFGLAYITLMFYLLFKVGIIQCIIRSLCKMCCAACETYWFAVQDLTCFLWHKIKNTKRVYRGRGRQGGRRRFLDIEEGYSSGSTSDGLDSYHGLGRSTGRKRKSIFGERGKIRRHHNSHSYHRQHHHHVKLRTKEISVKTRNTKLKQEIPSCSRGEGGSQRLRNSRRLQLVKTRNTKLFKRRRVR